MLRKHFFEVECENVLMQILQKGGFMGTSHPIWSRFCRRGSGIWGICHCSRDAGRFLAFGTLLSACLGLRLRRGIGNGGRHGWMGYGVCRVTGEGKQAQDLKGSVAAGA